MSTNGVNILTTKTIPADVQRLWAQTQLHVWAEDYWLLSLPHANVSYAASLAAASVSGLETPAFAALVIERDEVSLTVADAVWQTLRNRFPNAPNAGPYSVITFALNLDLSVCGYLAPAAVRLADAGISIVPQCAYLKDHLLVKKEDTERAVLILETWIRECREAGE